MSSDSMIGAVVRHSLPEGQLEGLIDMLVVMLESPQGEIKLSHGEGEGMRMCAVPPVAFEAMLDVLSMLASTERATLIAVDERQRASVSDLMRITNLNERRLKEALGEMAVVGDTRANGWGKTFLLADVIDACRKRAQAAAENAV